MARSYAVIAPDAGHAQHMVSHIYNGLGMWAESERANTLATRVTNRNRAKKGEGPHFCGHYNEWLVYARLQQGKDARPIIEGCRSQAEAELARFKSSGKPGFPGAAFSYGDMAVRYGIETGQWLKPLDFSLPFYGKPRFDFANARMLASRGNAAESAAALVALKTEAAATIAQIKKMSSGTGDVVPWVEAAVTQGEAIHSLSSDDIESGLRQLRAAAAAEAALPAVFGPPPIRKPSYELLGEVLLELGRKEEAAEAFRKSLLFAPGRRLSLAGLANATE